MRLHGNARLTPFQRPSLRPSARGAVDGRRRRGSSWLLGADCLSVVARATAGGSMLDRPSAPKSRPTRTAPAVEAEIERLRRLGFTSTRIAATLGLPVSTVCAVLARIGLNRLSRLAPAELPNRYCRRHAGELVHLDVKKPAGSTSLATASPVEVQEPTAAGAAGGKRCMCASTSPPASLTSRSSRTSSPPRPSPSWSGPLLDSPSVECSFGRS